MGCRGVYFALDQADAQRVSCAAGDDDALVEILQEEIEERWDQDWLCETDKAWDAIHRCLAGGRLGSDGSTRSKCVLGGRQLHAGADYIVNFLEPDEVRAVARDISGIDERWMRHQYALLANHGYDGAVGDEDFNYTWQYFQEVREFFAKTAAAGRSVVFTVDL